jgi:hypothetical protein
MIDSWLGSRRLFPNFQRKTRLASGYNGFMPPSQISPKAQEKFAGVLWLALGAFFGEVFWSWRSGFTLRPPKDFSTQLLCEVVSDTFAVLAVGMLAIGACYVMGAGPTTMARLRSTVGHNIALAAFVLSIVTIAVALIL